MTSARSFLLACTALTAVAGFAMPASQAHAASPNLIIAQAQPPAQPGQPDDKEKKKEQPGKPPAPAVKPPAPPAPPPAAKPPAPPPAVKPPSAPPPAVQSPAPPPPPAIQHPAPPPPPAAHPPAPPPPAAQPKPAAPPPAAQTKPAAPPPPPAVQTKPAAPPPPPAAQTKPVAPPPPPAAQIKPVAPPPPAAQTKPAAPPPPPAAQIKPAAPPPSSATQTQPAAPPSPAPSTHGRPGASSAAPAAVGKPPAPTAQTPPAPNQPSIGAAGRAVQPNRPAAAAPPPPTQARSAKDFIRRDNQAPARGVADLRRERQEVREGSRTIITEGDRTIVRDGDRSIIRHNEADRFAIDARDVRVMERSDNTLSIIVRPDGTQIITTTDRSGRLLRRVRRDRDGRQIVIIDNRFAGPRPGYFVDVPPPRWRGRPERYVLDGDSITRDAIWSLFMAPPIERLDRRYTLEEVRYSEPLRAYMPRVDLDVHFDSGSWQLTPEQVDRLAEVADGLNRAISRNPREVFLIEGHTDAVGAAEDNLSLSDRRAEAVAVALTEQFQVPPENLVTQGYGEEYLKVPTDGPSRENRRVAIRRITPLIDRQAGR